MSKTQGNNGKVEPTITVAKIGIIVALLSLLGVIATAFFNYLGTRAQLEIPIEATRSVANLATATDIPTALPTIAPTALAFTPSLSPTSIPPTDTPPSSPELTLPATQILVVEQDRRSRLGDVELTVNKVEIIGQVGNRKLLRFYIVVNNQTDTALTFPLFGYFVAIDSTGQSYEADNFGSKWPDSFPPRILLSGSIDLKDSVPGDISTMSISFAHIFGFGFPGDKALTVSDISVP